MIAQNSTSSRARAMTSEAAARSASCPPTRTARRRPRCPCSRPANAVWRSTGSDITNLGPPTGEPPVVVRASAAADPAPATTPRRCSRRASTSSTSSSVLSSSATRAQSSMLTLSSARRRRAPADRARPAGPAGRLRASTRHRRCRGRSAGDAIRDAPTLRSPLPSGTPNGPPPQTKSGLQPTLVSQTRTGLEFDIGPSSTSPPRRAPLQADGSTGRATTGRSPRRRRFRRRGTAPAHSVGRVAVGEVDHGVDVGRLALEPAPEHQSCSGDGPSTTSCARSPMRAFCWAADDSPLPRHQRSLPPASFRRRHVVVQLEALTCLLRGSR